MSSVFVSCWSVKGGSGTTAIAAGLALLLGAQSPEGVLLVDLAGDAPPVLGLPEPEGPGVAEWLAAGAGVPADGWARLQVRAGERLWVVPRGDGPLPGGDRAEVLARLLVGDHRPVVVDCGVLAPAGQDNRSVGAPEVLAAMATRSVLVTRACYLSLRRATRLPLHPSGVAVVQEPGRGLQAADVAEALGVPLLAEIPYDGAVARAIDAGLLLGRFPRPLRSALELAA